MKSLGLGEGEGEGEGYLHDDVVGHGWVLRQAACGLSLQRVVLLLQLLGRAHRRLQAGAQARARLREPRHLALQAGAVGDGPCGTAALPAPM